ncbi:MAG: AsmA-like C-terminal region-containing protein, partial [Chthoniobacterales bacterium]
MPPSVIELPPRQKIARSFYRRWTWRRQLAASGLRLSLLALLALLAWGGWYLANKGFGRQWRTTVVEELRKRGVEASVRRLTLDPFRGLIAQDVRIYEFANRDKPLAVISEVSLDINYAALLHRQPFLNALDVRDADVTFPSPNGERNAPKAQLTQFRAHVYFPPEQIEISQAEGFFCGIRISATGQLIKRSDYRPGRVVTEEEWRERFELLQGLAAQLSRFTFNGDAPSLQVKFAGDLSQMENAHVEATLQAERLQRGEYGIKTFLAAAEWIDQKLNVTRLEWEDHAGKFAGRASFNSTTRQAEIKARSSVDAKALLDAFGFPHLLADAAFAAPPAVDLSGSVNFSEARPRLKAIGHVALESFTYKTVPLLGLTTDYSWDGDRAMLRDLRVRHATGELAADLLDAPGDFRLKLGSSINPTALRGLAPVGLRQFLSEWEWPRAPSIRLAIRGPGRDPKTWSGEGTLALQRTRFRGVWMNSAAADVRLDGGAVTFHNLRVVRDEGVGTGAFTYDFAKQQVRVQDVHTSLRPAEAIYWIDPKLFKVVAPYKFRAPPKLTANGVVQLHGAKGTHLEIGIEAPSGMDHVFLGKNLPFDRVRGKLLISDERVQLLGLEGAVFDGAVRGTADISVAKNDPRYSAAVTVEGVDFPRLTDLYFKYETARGRLSGSYDWHGLGDDARTMQGSGKVKVANGDVFAIPIFGPLSGLVAAIIPGAGY